MSPRPHQRKLRADSKLAGLSLAQREELADMLVAGCVSQAEALAWLAERGVTMSATSLSQYYRLHILPTKWRRAHEAARTLSREGKASTVLADATRLAVEHKLFELATSQECDHKTLATLFRLIIDCETTEQAERKLSLLEQKEKAARAALAPREDGRTPEQKLADMRAIFGLV